jgi:hypothetical protein
MKTFKTYTFIIGTTDDFESIDALMSYVERDSDPDDLNYSVFEFEAPSECDLSTVQLIGYGYAFENDWSRDGTHSFFIEGSLDGPAERDAFNQGVAAREALKAQRNAS